MVFFKDNHAVTNGGATYIMEYSNILFDNSFVVYHNNSAKYGGAIILLIYSHVVFHGNSEVKFNDNHATLSGRSIYIGDYCNMSISKNSAVTITQCNASYGEGIYSRYAKM